MVKEETVDCKYWLALKLLFLCIRIYIVIISKHSSGSDEEVSFTINPLITNHFVWKMGNSS